MSADRIEASLKESMAKIIYGVAGEGAGHSSRAQEMVRHLERTGHKVVVVSYGQGVKNLSGTFDVVETEGLYFSARDNKLSIPKTIRDNLAAVAGPPGEKVDFTSLARAIELLAEGADIDYEGVSGSVDLDGHGDVTGGSYGVWAIREGEIREERVEVVK